MKNINYMESFRRSFEALGYKKLGTFPVFSSGDILYQFECQHEEIFHLVYLRSQGSRRCYAISVGAFNKEQLTILKKIVPTMMKYQFQNSAPVEFPLLKIWMMFVLNVSDYGNLSSIPDPKQRDGWSDQLIELKERVLKPFFWPIRCPGDIQDLLLLDIPPFKWLHHSVLRIAQILVLGKVVGQTPDEARNKVFSMKDLVKVPFELNYEVMVDEFINLIFV